MFIRQNSALAPKPMRGFVEMLQFKLHVKVHPEKCFFPHFPTVFGNMHTEE